MAFQLGQYNKNSSSEDESFMTLITEGTALRQLAKSDSGIQISGSIFTNECVKTSLASGINYYFHGKIKRMLSSQTFYVKLIQYTGETTQPGELEQYIKTITIAEGDPHEWVDVEFLFTPVSNDFDAIVFELTRTTEDYRIEARSPLIIYEELSEINNIITSKIKTGVKLIKIGVQSRPGLIMCINGEEIRTSRTGMFELRDNLVPVSFFSIARAGIESSIDIESTMNDLANQWTEAEDKTTVHSVCLFNEPKNRIIDNFILDYIYNG